MTPAGPHLCQHLLRVGQRKGVPTGAAAVAGEPQCPGRLADRRRLCATLCLARPSWLPVLRCSPVCTQVLRFLPCRCAGGSSCLSGSFSSRQFLLSSHAEERPCSALLGTLCLAGCSLLICIWEGAPCRRRRARACTHGGVPASTGPLERQQETSGQPGTTEPKASATAETLQAAGGHTCQATPCQGATVQLPALPDGGPSPLTLRPGQGGLGAGPSRWNSPALQAQPMLVHLHPHLTHRQAALMQRWVYELASSSLTGSQRCCRHSGVPGRTGVCAPDNHSLLQWVFAASC